MNKAITSERPVVMVSTRLSIKTYERVLELASQGQMEGKKPNLSNALRQLVVAGLGATTPDAKGGRDEPENGPTALNSAHRAEHPCA
jgi:hypothetical protein